jgi:ABC-type transporter Mla subunit MlaD
MTADNDLNYFKIGSFVLIGLGLIIFALLIFGSNKLFQRIIYIETYFNESIQGISEGTPVKYRGLQVGYVKKISFTSEVYDSPNNSPHMKIHDRSIYVKMAITSKLFTRFSKQEVDQFLKQEIEQGLRVKLVAQGLTGTSYLELNYVDPKNNPFTVAVNWRSNDLYIPAVTSTLTRISENVQYILNGLKDVDFKKIFNDIDVLTISLKNLVTKTDIS